MRFIADESCDFGVVRALRHAGHDVLTISEMARPQDGIVAEEQLLDDRRKKIEAIRALGIDPYGHKLDGVASHAAVREIGDGLKIEPGQSREDAKVRIAGRIVLLRVMGKLSFFQIRDSTGDIQIGVSKSDVGEPGWALLRLL